MPKQDTETKKGVSGVQELREAIKDGLANHTGEFLNPWLIKTTSNYSHEQLAQILDSILDSERLYKNLQSVIDKSVNEARKSTIEDCLDDILNTSVSRKRSVIAEKVCPVCGSFESNDGTPMEDCIELIKGTITTELLNHLNKKGEE